MKPVAREPRRAALLLAGGLVSGLVIGLAGTPLGRSQTMLSGCQLVAGTLQCVPGVTADPQQQIKDLRQQIATDQALENTVEQRIEGLSQMVLIGEVSAGSLLVATLAAGLSQDPLVQLPPGAFHWYRFSPGSSAWVLIDGASGPSYRLQPQDVGSQLMLVVAMQTPQGIKRQATAAVGPVQRANP